MVTQDHLVLLVAAVTEEFLQPFREVGFDVLIGGTHADGLTENALIIFPDGVYVELIAFTSSTTPEKRRHHPWGSKRNGWIDFALSPLPSTSSAVVQRVNSTAGKRVYQDPVAGGRITPDGKELKWTVASPVVGESANDEERGVLPFFCEDVTDRNWRVPKRAAKQPNGATGVAKLVVLTEKGKASEYTERLATAFDVSPSKLELATPGGSLITTVEVREPSGEIEDEWVRTRGAGLFQVDLRVQSEEEARRLEGLERIGARIVLTT